jgi:acyl-[acyl-carrier-protein] desaturase
MSKWKQRSCATRNFIHGCGFPLIVSYDPSILAELEAIRPEIPVGLLTRSQRHRSMEEAILGLYRWYVDRSQTTRNWNPDKSFKWNEIRKDHSEEMITILSGFFAVEQYVPDYSAKLTEMTRKSHGRSHFQIRWGSEEERHAMLWYNACLFTEARTKDDMYVYMEELREKEWAVPWDDPMHMTFYTVFQERATQVNYLKTLLIAEGKAEAKVGHDDSDPVLAAACKMIAIDEAAHYNFFLEAARLYMYYFPEEAIQAMLDVIEHFAMPAMDIIPDSAKFFETVYNAGVYGPRQLSKDVFQVALDNLGVEGRKALERGIRNSRRSPDGQGGFMETAVFEGIDFSVIRKAVGMLGRRIENYEKDAGLSVLAGTKMQRNYEGN